MRPFSKRPYIPLWKVFPHVQAEAGALVMQPDRVSFGLNCYVGEYSILEGDTRGGLTIGSNVWMGAYVFIQSAGGVRIEDNIGIGPYCAILASQHDAKGLGPVLDTPLVFRHVHLKEGCDIGTGSTILPGVTIGKGAVIGAGSVVTKDISDYCIAVGNPCKVIKERNNL